MAPFSIRYPSLISLICILLRVSEKAEMHFIPCSVIHMTMILILISSSETNIESNTDIDNVSIVLFMGFKFSHLRAKEKEATKGILLLYKVPLLLFLVRPMLCP